MTGCHGTDGMQRRCHRAIMKDRLCEKDSMPGGATVYDAIVATVSSIIFILSCPFHCTSLLRD